MNFIFLTAPLLEDYNFVESLFKISRYNQYNPIKS
jgi:hypothetical protein